MALDQKSSQFPQVLRGSLYTLRRKCGKPTCRCSDGEQHETPALSYSLHGSTKLLTLRPQDVREVKAALKRYRQALQNLNQKALVGIRTLGQRIRSEKAHARKARR
ncbi:MAG: hypothetical protein HY922_14580 [Elusimicrobia bacterium]|nr:hypothetical protein [Elusimicrobiota bacterium]